ncbi:MAG: hypothetical protein LBJ32_02145 [Oscillospiraceae bacterium]|nr:hypothetical protein [Oscillospiraceae bacterium]
MLKKGQIKFTVKAAEIAKQFFIKKNANEFLVAVNEEDKPSGAKDIYKKLLSRKQDSSNELRVYATDIIKAERFLTVNLLKEGRLSFILSLDLSCLLYIAKSQQDKYEKIKMPELDWPIVFLDESKNSNVTEFERKMNKSVTIDLPDLILSINE